MVSRPLLSQRRFFGGKSLETHKQYTTNVMARAEVVDNSEEKIFPKFGVDSSLPLEDPVEKVSISSLWACKARKASLHGLKNSIRVNRWNWVMKLAGYLDYDKDQRFPKWLVWIPPGNGGGPPIVMLACFLGILT